MVFTVNHINESNILLFYNNGELKHIQTDNNNMKTLGKINKSQAGNIKRIFGRMFKLNSARDTVYWKKSNNEIVKQSLFGKQKAESIIYVIKEKGDYLVDFQYDERNENLYALSHYGKIFLKGFSRQFQTGIIGLDAFERVSHDHYSTILKISPDFKYMVIGSYEISSKHLNVRLNLFQLNENSPTSPKVKHLDEKCIPIEPGMDKDSKDYIQAIDISLRKYGEMYLSMFLRYSCEVHIFKIKDNRFKDYVFKQKIATEWINDVVYSSNNIFCCFENETIGRLYPNDIDDDEYQEQPIRYSEGGSDNANDGSLDGADESGDEAEEDIE